MTCRRLSSASRQTALGLVCFLLAVGHVGAREFSVRALTDEKGNARNPDISQTGLIAWQAYSPDPDGTVGAVRSDIFVLHPGERDARNITLEDDRINGRCERPIVFDDSVAFLAWFKKDITSTGYPFELSIPPKNEEMKKLEDDYPELFDPPIPTLQPDEEDEQAAAPTNTVDAATLEAEVDANATTNGLAPQRQMWRGSGQAGDLALYRVGNPIERITPGNRHYNSPAGSSAGLAVQVARGWPYGYEMIVWRQGSANIIQLTTNYYYALNANMHEQELVFQAWDGNDYEIFHYRFDTDEIKQITNNQFDDVSPSSGTAPSSGSPTPPSPPKFSSTATASSAKSAKAPKTTPTPPYGRTKSSGKATTTPTSKFITSTDAAPSNSPATPGTTWPRKSTTASSPG